MRHFLVALSLSTVLLAGPAGAQDEAAPFRVQVGSTTAIGANVPGLGRLMHDGLAGVEACGDTIQDWQAPNPAGWAASFRMVTTEKGRIYEFGWNKGHVLPPKTRRCIKGLLKEVDLPKWDQRGYLVVQQTFWVLPADAPPMAALPTHDQVPHADVVTAAEPFLFDIDECMIYGSGGIDIGHIRGQLDAWLTVGEDGTIVATALSAVQPAWLTRANCVASSLAKMEFDRSEAGTLRMARVRVIQVNFHDSARRQYEDQIAGHNADVRLPVLVDPSAAR